MTSNASAPSDAFADWLLASYAGGLLAIDGAERVRLASDEARRALALPDDALGRPASEVLAHLPRVLDLLRAAAAGTRLPAGAELELPSEGPAAAAQPRTRIGISLQSIVDPEGRPAGATLFVRRLDALEHADEQARLQARLAALGAMAADWAHEVQNPLATTGLLVGLLERELDGNAAAAELLVDLRAALAEIGEMTRDALAYVKPQAMAPQEQALAPAVESAVERALDRVAFDGRTRIEIDASARVAADPEQLARLLLNLSVNALQAMSEAGPRAGGHELVWRAGPDPRSAHHLLLTLDDSGPGVPDELRERIFQPFFSTRGAGSGIGLADAQKIVAAHGGGIGVGPTPDGGACFRIALPGSVAPRPTDDEGRS